MPPCGTQDDENMMVLWRRSLYWSSSSVAVLAALVVLVIFERRASPYPLHLGRGSLFVPGARFSEQWIMCHEHCGCVSFQECQQGGHQGCQGCQAHLVGTLGSWLPIPDALGSPDLQNCQFVPVYSRSDGAFELHQISQFRRTAETPAERCSRTNGCPSAVGRSRCRSRRGR